MIEIQTLPRSVHELLILTAIAGGAKHGYQVALEIEDGTGGFFTFNHGTLYPILHHLEKEGLIDGSWDEGRGRQRRKTYALTASGREHLRQRVADWGTFTERLGAFLQTSPALRPRAATGKR